CLDSRRSYSGFIFQLGLSTISWKCRKQKSVASSSTEAEYMALAMTVKYHIWLKNALFELLKDSSIPSAVFADNMSAIDIAHNRKVNDRSKYIDIVGIVWTWHISFLVFPLYLSFLVLVLPYGWWDYWFPCIFPTLTCLT